MVNERKSGIIETPTLEIAYKVFQSFVEPIAQSARITALHDSDADGVTAGVLWQQAFQRAGFINAVRVVPDRERNAWTATNREQVSATAPKRLFILDLGSRAEAVIPGVPTCFIDHHRPEGVPAGDTLISAYTWQPIPNTSLLIWELCQTMADISDLDWVAAIGTISDLGERAPFDLLATAKRKYTAKYLKEATALINASRRASVYNPEVAARALLMHQSPKELANSTTEEVEQLRAARAEVKQELEAGRKVAPIFAGQVALIQLDSPCQIHPLIAQSWATRLPKYVVIAANKGYIPGRVNFSARSAQINVLNFLKSQQLSEGEGTFGHGHDQASGGSLPIERWNELLKNIGFSVK